MAQVPCPYLILVESYYDYVPTQREWSTMLHAHTLIYLFGVNSIALLHKVNEYWGG